MKKFFYDQIFNWYTLVKLGYMDFQPTGWVQHENIESARSGKTDVFYYDFLNFDDLVRSDVLPFLTNYNYVRQNTEPIVFTIPKKNEVRRTLKFQNLYSYLHLVQCLVANKQQITHALMTDKNSTSRFFGWKPFNFEKTERMRDGLLFGHQYFFKTDFSSFYHTMYTHAIAWLIMGKEKAKADHNPNNNLGNELDSLIEKEQYGETHGLPTGNLVTRIVVEFCMACFDTELRDSLPPDVSFNRYVDDYTFAYNRAESLNASMTQIRRLSGKYELLLNESKVAAVNYSSLANQGHVLHYFDEYTDLKNMSQMKIVGLINSFLKAGLKDQSSGVKGSDKLVFTGLRFWFKKLNSSSKKQLLLALVFSDTDVGEASIIQKLIQRVVLDSRLVIYFLQLLDELLIFSKRINNKALSMHLEFVCLKFRANAQMLILQALALNEHQSVYALLLIYVKAQVNYTDKFIENFLDIALKDETEFDDLSMLLLLNKILLRKDEKLVFFLGKIDLLFKKFTDFNRDVFSQKHWLLRYELLNQYKNNVIFKNAILKYYRAKHIKNGKRSLDLTNIRKCYLNKKLRCAPKRNEVLVFFNHLLEMHVTFSKIDDHPLN